MKRSIPSKTDEEMLEDFPLKSITDGWFIKIEEVSNGYWKAEAQDRFGRVVNKVSADGNLEFLLKETEEIIADLSKVRFE